MFIGGHEHGVRVSGIVWSSFEVDHCLSICYPSNEPPIREHGYNCGSPMRVLFVWKPVKVKDMPKQYVWPPTELPITNSHVYTLSNYGVNPSLTSVHALF